MSSTTPTKADYQLASDISGSDAPLVVRAHWAHKIREHVAAELTAAREALEACRVFTTPLERLKGWNEFKEDAARRVNAALEAAR